MPQTRFERIRANEWPSGPRRAAVRQQIEQLDPRLDAGEILRESAGRDLPWEYRTSILLTLAELGVSAAILTGDDVLHLIRDGRDRAANRPTLNRLRAYAYQKPDDAQQLLAALAVMPSVVCAEFGWRYLTPAETAAAAAWYSQLAETIGLQSFPSTFQGLQKAAGDLVESVSTGRYPASVYERLLADLLPRHPTSLLSQAARTAGQLTTPLTAAALAIAGRTPLRPIMTTALREAGLVRRQWLLLRSAPAEHQ